MPGFEGAPPVYVAQSHRLEEDGYRMCVLILGNHAGTHLDAPSHFVASGTDIETVPLDRCIGEAIVCDFSSKAALEPISAADLDREAGDVGPGARLLIRTDWDAHFGRDDYFTDFPPLAPDAAAWFADRRVWLVGVDIPSLHQTEFAQMHTTMLGAGIAIVESLANLRALTTRRVFFSSLPIKLTGADGAPVRAVAYDGLPNGLASD